LVAVMEYLFQKTLLRSADEQQQGPPAYMTDPIALKQLCWNHEKYGLTRNAYERKRRTNTVPRKK